MKNIKALKNNQKYQDKKANKSQAARSKCVLYIRKELFFNLISYALRSGGSTLIGPFSRYFWSMYYIIYIL